MKSHLKLLTWAMALTAGLLTVAAAENRGGPKGGKLLENASSRAEFFVEKNGKVTISFYDENLKPVPVADQKVTVIARVPSGPRTLEFEKKDGVLVSDKALPEGEGYTVVVQLQETPGAKSQNFRIKYDTHLCAECKRAEYACICGH